MLDILKKIPKGYFQTEFDLVNNTNFPVSFNLFDVNTLNTVETQAQPILPPSVISNFYLGAGKAPVNLAYCPVNNSVYILSAGDDSISVYDCSLGTISVLSVGAISVGLGYITYCSQNNTMYIVDGSSATVLVIDCSTNTIVDTILGAATSFFLVYNSLQNLMYFGGSGTIGIIDCSNNNTVSYVSIPTILNPSSYNSSNNTVYCLDFSGNTANIFDCNTNTILGSTIVVGSLPSRSVYNSVNNYIYVTNNGSNSVSVIDCSTNLVISTIALGYAPFFICYNVLSNLIYVTSLLSNNDISVIDCSTNTLLSPISSVGKNPFGIVFNTNDDTLYSADYGSDDLGIVSPISQTTTYIGGTFNYNQFIQDIQDNPALVRDVMFYSSDPDNINQVFFTLFKDANGKSSYTPQYPQLSVGVNQFQGSVSKVDFGEKGFPLDVTHSFYNVTVQANSTLKLVLIMKQMKKAYSLDAPDISENMDLIKNGIQYIKGVDGRNNIERFSVFNLGKDEK